MTEPVISEMPPLVKGAPREGPGLLVTAATRSVRSDGTSGETKVAPFRVHPDTAGDLSWQPQGGYWVMSKTWSRGHGSRRPEFTWEAWGLGFIEHEALDALEAAVTAALASAGLRPCCATEPDGGHRGTCPNSFMMGGTGI